MSTVNNNTARVEVTVLVRDSLNNPIFEYGRNQTREGDAWHMSTHYAASVTQAAKEAGADVLDTLEYGFSLLAADYRATTGAKKLPKAWTSAKATLCKAARLGLAVLDSDGYVIPKGKLAEAAKAEEARISEALIEGMDDEARAEHEAKQHNEKRAVLVKKIAALMTDAEEMGEHWGDLAMDALTLNKVKH